jgi:hypothetical protein
MHEDFDEHVAVFADSENYLLNNCSKLCIYVG